MIGLCAVWLVKKTLPGSPCPAARVKDTVKGVADSHVQRICKSPASLLMTNVFSGRKGVDDNENMLVPVSSPWPLGDNFNEVGVNFG